MAQIEDRANKRNQDNQVISSSITPSAGRIYYEEEDHGFHHGKKNVMAKVKEKAKKWKQLLARKKHGQGHGGANATPEWGVELDDDSAVDDAEHHGHPFNQFETTREDYRHIRVVNSLPVRNSSSEDHKVQRFQRSKTSLDTISERKSDEHVTEGKKLMKSVSDVTASPATEVTESKKPIEAAQVPVATTESDASHAKDNEGGFCQGTREISGELVSDKGVSVKEYLMQKLEPGAGEKALSEVISEAITPNATDAEGKSGVVEKLMDAMTSLIAAPDTQPPDPTASASSSSSPQPTSLPLSTNPVTDYGEEVHGKTLQMN